MWIKFVNLFTKITAWPVQWICFRTKIFYEDKHLQSRKISGSAIVVSNHTSVYDYAVMLFVFPFRTLRYQMAEILFEKKLLGSFLKGLGGIQVDRNHFDFSFIAKSEMILNKGGVVGIFPESRLAREGEERPLPFVPSAAYLALLTGAPVIPVYTNGSYFRRERAAVMIGKPMDFTDLMVTPMEEKERIELASQAMRNRIIELEKEYHGYCK